MKSENSPAEEKEVSFMGGHQNNTKQGEEQGEAARRTPWFPLSSSGESFLNNHSVSPRLGAGIEI